MPSPILVVSGCSGVGKSTVSQLLVRRLGPSVHLPIDVFLNLFDDPFPDPGSADGARYYEMVGAASAAAAGRFALGGYTVILDSPMFPDGAEGMAGICAEHGVAVHYAVLQADLDTCLERSRRRDPGGPPDLDGFTDLHSRFSDLSHREGHAIDASESPEQVTGNVLSAFRSGQLALHGGSR